jgi:hypothetical protein
MATIRDRMYDELKERENFRDARLSLNSHGWAMAELAKEECGREEKSSVDKEFVATENVLWRYSQNSAPRSIIELLDHIFWLTA